MHLTWICGLIKARKRRNYNSLQSPHDKLHTAKEMGPDDESARYCIKQQPIILQNGNQASNQRAAH